jgi:hypothetical protein
MKWYFASRMRHKDSINRVIDFLKSHGHSIAYEWSKSGSLKPYQENADQAAMVAGDIGEALKEVDVFVLIADAAGTDMFIELGMAIGRWQSDNTTKIYVVGDNNNRSLMHFHPAIKRLDTLRDVFALECPKLLDEDNRSFAVLLDSRL